MPPLNFSFRPRSRNTSNYLFKDCKCNNSTGRAITIQNGIRPVAELGLISVYVNRNIIHELDVSTFQLFKIRGQATLVN
jgi:hypothetical protein